MSMHSILGSIVTFLISLLVGGLGIYVGARVLTDVDDFGRALKTALFAALGWAIVSLIFGWVPVLGAFVATVLGFLVYLSIINWQYPGGFLKAAGIALVAWIAAAIVLTLLGFVLPPEVGAVGVAGT